MKKEAKEALKITGIILLIVFMILVAFVNILILYDNGKNYNHYCRDKGYDHFEHQGLIGDFCVSNDGALQVIEYRGKLIPVEK